MGCTFKLNGLTFENELALDDYLLLTLKAFSKYGDIVFSSNLSPTQIDYISKLKLSAKEFEELKKLGKVKEYVDVENHDLDSIMGEKPYIGTTELIRNLSTLLDDLIIPEFKSENYWSHRQILLKTAKKAIEEGDDIISKYDIPIIFNEVDLDDPNYATAYSMVIDGQEHRYDVHDITDENEFKNIRQRYEKMWKLLSLSGTAIHNVMSIMLNYKDLLWNNPNIDEVIAIVKSKLKNEDKPWLDSTDDSKLKNLIQLAITIRNNIKAKFGEKCYILPEHNIIEHATLDDLDVPVLGRLDLLVIGEDGETLVLDFKVSQRDWVDYNSAKKLTFNYQLNIYAKLLKRLGINLKIGKWIIPIKMEGFSINKADDSLTFSGTSIIEDTPLLQLPVIDSVDENLEGVFPEDAEKDDFSTNEVLTAVDNFNLKCFPEYYNYANMTVKLVQEITDGKIIQNPKTLQWEFKNNDLEIITGSTKRECFKKVEEKLRGRNTKVKVAERTKDFKKALKEGMKIGHFDFTMEQYSKVINKYGKSNWLFTYFLKYANSRYRIVDEDEGIPPQFEQLGIIVVENLNNHSLEILKISKSGHALKQLNQLNTIGSKTNPRKYILGTFQSDVLSHNSSDSLTLEATLGNIELMEAMAALNCMPRFLTKHPIAQISVLNPDHLDHLTASNKLLLYNFTRLSDFIKVKNNFAYNLQTSSGIRMLSYTLKVSCDLRDILRRVKEQSGYDRFGSITSNFVTKFDDVTLSQLLLLSDLVNLKDSLEENFKQTLGEKVLDAFSENDNPEIPLYNDVLYAIAELNGIDLVQQIMDHDKWMLSSVKHALIEGVNGNYTDNPGTLKSDTLNKLASITEQAYLNARVDLLRYNENFLKEVEELKDSKSFGWLEKVTIGNQANLYKKMYDLDHTTDLIFKNPFDPLKTADMTEVEIKFLKKTLIDILSKRSGFNNVIDELSLRVAIQNDPETALQVPLMKGTVGSQRAYGGWILTIKNKLMQFSPKRIKLTVKEEMEGFFKDDTLKLKILLGECFEMSNLFDAGFNPSERVKMLERHKDSNGNFDLSYWEHNLERIRLNYNGAVIMKQKLDKVFPTLKAIIMHLKYSSFILNDNFPSDIQYALDYIKNKIFNLPIDDIEKWGTFKLLSTKLMSEMSKFTLAFNPKLLYQTIDGLWKDIMLIIQKPDGSQTFSKKNMIDSFMWIVKDVRHFGDKLTLGEYLNLQYGINDQDINSISDKMTNDNAGIHNFWSIGYRFASRPDYYNRMTIFGALMREDGTFEAYELDSKTGNWKYNFKKDKRFQHLIKGETDHKDYAKEKALYIKMMLDFTSEGATYEDGTKVNDAFAPKHIKPLPRAYTTRQSESMKAIGDKIYGYYSHEKRSMILAYSLGALFMHMNTFWSSKKNLYLSGRTFTQLGNYVQYEEPEVDENGEVITDENGNRLTIKFWLVMDENNNLKVVSDKEITDPNQKKIPYMVWKGRPQEGIIVTVMNLAKTALTDTNNNLSLNNNRFHEVIHMDSDLWRNMDPEERVLYQANLRQLLYDLLMFLIMGMLIAPALLNGAKSYSKEVGNEKLDLALCNNSLITLASMLETSTDDFNFTKSIFGRGINWTPFSISQATRLTENFVKVCEGHTDIYDSLVNSFGASRSNRALMDWAKLEMFDTKLGTNMNNKD